MLTIDEFKRAYSRTDIVELLSADNLTETEQLVLFEELKLRALEKIRAYDLDEREIKFTLAEFIMLELKKRHASTMEYQALVEIEKSLLASLEKRRTMKNSALEQTVQARRYTSLNTNIKDFI